MVPGQWPGCANNALNKTHSGAWSPPAKMCPIPQPSSRAKPRDCRRPAWRAWPWHDHRGHQAMGLAPRGVLDGGPQGGPPLADNSPKVVRSVFALVLCPCPFPPPLCGKHCLPPTPLIPHVGGCLAARAWTCELGLERGTRRGAALHIVMRMMISLLLPSLSNQVGWGGPRPRTTRPPGIPTATHPPSSPPPPPYPLHRHRYLAWPTSAARGPLSFFNLPSPVRRQGGEGAEGRRGDAAKPIVEHDFNAIASNQGAEKE